MSSKQLPTKPQKLKREDLEAWDHVDPLRVIDAAHLWADFIPTSANSAPDGRIHRYCEIIRSKWAKIDPGSSQPDLTHYCSRSGLEQIAHEIGEKPKFLYPSERRKRSGLKPGTKQFYKNCYEEVAKLIKEKGYSVSTASSYVAEEIDEKPETVERNYRRYRKQFVDPDG
jgi:hypothetical protein